MAIIRCPECGKEVSNKAVSCPNCGYPIQSDNTIETKYGVLWIERKEAALYFAGKYDIIIDGENCGTLKNGDELFCSLPCGKHSLKVNLKGNGGKNVYDEVILIEEEGIHLWFYAAAISLKMNSASIQDDERKQIEASGTSTLITNNNFNELSYYESPASSEHNCPKCGAVMQAQVVNESRKAGCLTVIIYFILALTIFGLFIVIPLLLRKKTETTTYLVCQRCGYKEKIK